MFFLHTNNYILYRCSKCGVSFNSSGTIVLMMLQSRLSICSFLLIYDRFLIVFANWFNT